MCTLGWALLAAWQVRATAPTVPSLTVNADKTAAGVGDVVWVNLTFALPEGARLADAPVVEGIEGHAVVDRQVREGEIKIGLLVDRVQSFQIGPLALVYRDQDGSEQRLTADPVTIEVQSNLGEQPEQAVLRPIQDIVPTASFWPRYLIWAAAALILAGLGIGAWYWYRRRSSPVIEARFSEPPNIRAERDIDRLVAGGLFETGDVKGFYFELSGILRRYMEAIRGYPAAEMTTEEIARRVAAEAGDQAILPLLRQADLVKFADALPPPTRKDQDVLEARSYIRSTSASPAEAAGPESIVEVAP